MKKLYFLSLILGSTLGFAQTPAITGIMDGDCSGGNPKVIEIYANGTVNFADYTLENQTNATTGTWTQALNLSALGTRTNEYVYVIHGDAATVGPIFNAEFAAIPSTSYFITGTGTGVPQPMNVNGDDRLRIINSSMTVIDQFGVSDVDGTGTAWEYTDSWAKRNNTTATGANFNTADWTFGGVASLNNLGTCQAAAAFSTIVPFGNSTASTKNFDAIAGLSLYPNPVTGNVLNITSAANLDMNVAIFDVLGKQVINTKVTNNTVNVSNLNAGVYIVKVTEDGKTATRKLVVK